VPANADTNNHKTSLLEMAIILDWVGLMELENFILKYFHDTGRWIPTEGLESAVQRNGPIVNGGSDGFSQLSHGKKCSVRNDLTNSQNGEH
jgi:hypothetical protein